MKKEFPNHPETELILTYVQDIVSLYNSCDVLYSLTFTECFFLPALQGLALDKIVMVPRYGGQLDFCNDSNSFLIEGKVTRADQRMQYWVSNVYNGMFSSDIDDAVDKLKYIYNNFDKVKVRNNQDIRDKYTWANVSEKIKQLMV
jgi:glycosyltransferase involved in cell wall biosynthesis